MGNSLTPPLSRGEGATEPSRVFLFLSIIGFIGPPAYSKFSTLTLALAFPLTSAPAGVDLWSSFNFHLSTFHLTECPLPYRV